MSDMTFSATSVAGQLASARAGLANMLAGYRSQSSWYNNKDAQAEGVADLVQQAEKPFMPFAPDDHRPSIAQLFTFTLALREEPGVGQIWNLDPQLIGRIGRKAVQDVVRMVENVRSKPILANQEISRRASTLLWGHHVLRDGWVYDDIDFELFDDDTHDNFPSSRVLEEPVEGDQCNASALNGLIACFIQQTRRIEACFLRD